MFWSFFDYVSAHVERLYDWINSALFQTWDAIDDYLTTGASATRALQEKHAGVSRFIDTALSFFDDYQVINGVPVFALGSPDIPGRRQHSKAIRAGLTPRTPRLLGHPVEEVASSTSEEEVPEITHTSFSPDGTRLLTGYTNGDVCVWDAQHGNLLTTLKDRHKCQIVACNFIGVSNNVVASVDTAYHIVRWDLTTREAVENELKQEQGAEALDPDLCQIGFSKDGTVMGLASNTPVDFTVHSRAVIPFDRRDSTAARTSRKQLLSLRKDRGLRVAYLDVYRMDSGWKGVDLRREQKLTVVWSPDVPKTLNGVHFSENGRGVLVGLYSLSNKASGSVVLWPDWSKPGTSISLSGSLGSWSWDGSLVVTWDPFIQRTSVRAGSSRGTCFVWDVDDIRSKINSADDLFWDKEHQKEMGIRLKDRVQEHPNMGPKYEARKPLFEDSQNALWARFVASPVGDECHKLAVCTVGKEIVFRIWSVETNTLVQTLHTGVKMTNALANWVGEFVAGNETESVGISPDRKWLGLYVAEENKGFIWNAVQGVTFLNISLPDKMVQDYKLSFGGPGCRMVMSGSAGALLWDTGAICSSSELGSGRQMYHYTIPEEASDGSIYKSLSSLEQREGESHPIVDLRFSLAGDKLGMISKGLANMHVLDFKSQILLHLKKDASHSWPFSSFNFSHDGHRLAAVLEDASVLMWHLDDKPGVHHANATLGRLRNSLVTCLGVVFSVDGKGRETVVVCDDSGSLIWLDTEHCRETHWMDNLRPKECSGCMFKADGSTATLLTEANIAIVIDLPSRTQLRRVEFLCPLTDVLIFPENVSNDATFAVAGWDGTRGLPIVCGPQENVDLSNADNIAEHMTISDDCAWLAKDVITGTTTARSKDRLQQLGLNDRGCLMVIPLRMSARVKGLESDKVPNPEALAISVDGRRIACAGAHQVVVWTPYATKGCVPDYYTLLVDGLLQNMNACEAALQEHGAALMNNTDDRGFPLLLNAVVDDNLDLVRTLVKYSQETRTRMLFRTQGSENSKNALELAIEGRSPEIAGILIKAMYDGTLSRTMMAHIFGESLVQLGRQYPTLFLEAIKGGPKGEGMPVTIGEIVVPEGVLKKSGFVVETFPKFLDHDVQQLWGKIQPGNRRRMTEIEVPALAKAFPFPNCCRLGMDGLLRPLLVSNGIPDEAFSTPLVHSIIEFKWQAYAHKMVIKEATIYATYVALFTAYAAALGSDDENQVNFDEDKVGPFIGEWHESQAVLLILSAIMGFLNFVVEVNQVVNDFKDGRRAHFNGVFYWAFSKWNLLELLSSIMTAFVIPATHFSATSESRDQRESVMVAITAIVLWWKLLYFATPFRATGPLVILIFEVLKDIVFFVVLLAAIMFGFSVAFFVTFRHDKLALNEDFMNEVCDGKNVTDECTRMLKVVCGGENRENCEDNDVFRAFGDYQRSLFTTFGMMLGDFDLELFFTDTHRFFPRVLFVAYMAAMMIIMLNLLIGLMGFSFSRVKESEDTTFLKARAATIDDVESMASAHTKKILAKRISTFLHIIVPRDGPNVGKRKEEEEQLEGRLGYDSGAI
ncbi:unnamed protein product [Ostreobium quekettii]|uniref:Ion transport domain-containing protein n=1 Tax=Ostreobium quekettii TaxID=121088 RepID=A0A8S1JBF0_9CHLO|nr:unnamed protein product [Ostreobium quekettii]